MSFKLIITNTNVIPHPIRVANNRLFGQRFRQVEPTAEPAEMAIFCTIRCKAPVLPCISMGLACIILAIFAG